MRSSLQLDNTESIETKQAYVYTNIFQSDYDIEQFAEYLAQQPPKYSSNLEELSYDTIKMAVDTFVDKHKSPSKLGNTEKGQSIAMSDYSKMDRFSTTDHHQTMDFYLKSKQCVKEINKFALTCIQVDIISYKKNQGRFLSRDFITFKIELPQLHKQIDRRYSQFEWLRNILIYFHPGIVVPPLPKKKMKKIFTDEHLKKKGRMLQNFLRKCLEIPDLRNDENTYRFLTMQNPQKFEQYIKQNKLQKGTVQMEKIKSATGKIEYGINDDLIMINKKGAEYFQKLSPFMKQLYKQVKRIEQSLGVCTLHLQNLQQLSKKFAPVEEQFRRQCNKREFYDDEEREKSFLETISVLAQKYKQQIGSMKQIWEKQLYVKLKYEFHHSQCLTEFINQYQSQEKAFYSMRESLNRKKMKIFSRPMNDWDISQETKKKFMGEKPSFNEAAPFLLSKKSLQLDQQQIKYALQTKQLANSISHYAKFNNTYNLKVIERFLQKEYKLESDWGQKMREMITGTLEFNVEDVSGLIKSKLAEGKNSIKGFFSQFDPKRQSSNIGGEKIWSSELIMEKNKQAKQGGNVYNGF